MPNIIKYDDLLKVQELLFLKEERCGVLNRVITPITPITPIFQNTLEVNRIFKVVVDEKAIIEKGMCKPVVFSEYIWHTHPYGSKSYPSSTDILKVIKKKNDVKCSLIFTPWGIWEIAGYKKFNLTQDKKERQTEYINAKFSKLYFSTEKGKAKNLTDENLESIYKLLDELSSHFLHYNLHIYFTPWKNIKSAKYTLKYM